jgi:hypothetical protein
VGGGTPDGVGGITYYQGNEKIDIASEKGGQVENEPDLVIGEVSDLITPP